jgi:hypothetical protein
MKHSIVLLFAAATIGLAAPVMASAQPPAFDNHGQSRPGGDLREREARLGDPIAKPATCAASLPPSAMTKCVTGPRTA